MNMDEFTKRFWSKVVIKGEDDCWEWQNATQSRGYGSLGIGKKGRTGLAHRVAYFLAYGDFPDGLCVLHKCDNRKCCNPNHLFLGTNQDNVDDKVSKARQAKGESHGKSKLTIEKVKEIRSLYETGDYSFKKLGDKYKISSTNARGIVKGDYWKLPLAE